MESPTEPVGTSGSTDAPRAIDPTGVTTRARRVRLFGGVAAIIVVLDQLTKKWALDGLDQHGETFDLFWTLRFKIIYNTGAAFSTGNGLGPIIGLAVIGIAIAVVVVALRTSSRVSLVLFGLILGGAVGNLLDRLFRDGDGFLGGAVIDFIDLQWWPVFNVADMAVVCGAALMVVFGMRAPADEQQ